MSEKRKSPMRTHEELCSLLKELAARLEGPQRVVGCEAQNVRERMDATAEQILMMQAYHGIGWAHVGEAVVAVVCPLWRALN